MKLTIKARFLVGDQRASIKAEMAAPGEAQQLAKTIFAFAEEVDRLNGGGQAPAAPLATSDARSSPAPASSPPAPAVGFRIPYQPE